VSSSEQESVVRASYDRLAAPYTDLFGDVARAHPLDRAMISGFADLSPAFVGTARTTYPQVRFEEGTMTALDLPGGVLAGALSWFSTIHAPQPALRVMLGETSRVLAPGGHLLLGFQAAEGEDEEPFDHRVVTAYRRPLDLVSRLLGAVGIVETTRVLRRPEAGERCSTGVLLARRA
jgi:hypothetical protein